MQKLTLLLFSFTIASHALYSQVTAPVIFNSCGGSITTAAGTFEFSIGEPVVFTSINANIVITQGVLQPFDDVLTAVDVMNISTRVKVFPNPTAMLVYLQPAFTQGGSLHCELYNASGQLMETREIKLLHGNEVQVFNIEQYTPGLYLLKVMFKTGNKEGITTYKIQKLK